jgi:hypothetical protein
VKFVSIVVSIREKLEKLSDFQPIQVKFYQLFACTKVKPLEVDLEASFVF